MSQLLQTAARLARTKLEPCLAVPANVERYDYRTYYAMLIANSMAFLLHFSWIFIFRSLDFAPLSWINVGSVLIWIFNIAILCRLGAVLTAVVIGSAEVVTHQALAIYYLGWGYGFQYYLLVVVAFAFMMNFKSIFIPATMFVVCLVAFLRFYYHVQYWNMPHADLGSTAQEIFLMANVTSAFAILAMMSYVYSEAARKAEAMLEIERQKSEGLLLNILPASIAERLKADSSVIADHFESATVMFADIVGFTAMSEQVTPTELVNRLNRLFSAFDDLAEQYGLEKIKTIGDAYMVAGGLPEQEDGHALGVCSMALDMLEVVAEVSQAMPQPIDIRIGIHTGPTVAGVIGIKKFVYDIWGDTVNTASRMESSGEPGRIQLSEQAAAQLDDAFVLEARGEVAVKGKGNMKTFWLLRRASGINSWR